jgi:hypothetical protein
VKKDDGDPETANQLQGSAFAEQIGAVTKLSSAAFDSFSDALEAADTPDENLVRLFELRHKLIQ